MMDHTRMRFEAELNQRFAEGKAEGKAEIVAMINEENHLLGKRLVADGRESEAIEVLRNPERRARVLERYAISVPTSTEA